MFNNLIESSSHRKEFRRRGSFLLLTTFTYALLLGASGVLSIYAYDAHLEAQTTELELVMFVPPEEHKEVAPQPKDTTHPTTNVTTKNTVESVRTELIDSPSNPNNVPAKIGTVASTVPPALSISKLGTYNADVLPTNSGRDKGPGDGDGRPNVVITDPPPPPPPPQPPKDRVVKVSRVLNSEALSLPKPRYPALALQIHLEGVVNVQVLIDETGKVVSAKAVSGHPMLIPDAVRAANQARFSPTTINDQPVKVSGVISYNFKLSN